MDKLDILIWAMGSGYGLILALLLVIWREIKQVENKLGNRIDKLDEELNHKIDKLDEKLSNRIDRLDEKVTDIDRRICRLEGAFASKDCCMIKDSSKLQRAE